MFVVRYTGKSPSLSSGPVADHTTGEEGYYALCDARQLRDPSDRCTLKKSVMVTQQSELSFWYFMFGSQIGTLELTVDGESVWSLTGSQEKAWLRATVQLDQGEHAVNDLSHILGSEQVDNPYFSFKIEFRASRSESGRTSADLAIVRVISFDVGVLSKLSRFNIFGLIG